MLHINANGLTNIWSKDALNVSPFLFFCNLDGIPKVLHRWVNTNKCTDSAAHISLSFVWPKIMVVGVEVQGMMYGTSLNICSENCQRCNEIASFRSSASSVSDAVGISTGWVSPALVFGVWGKKHTFPYYFPNDLHTCWKARSLTQTSCSCVSSCSINNPHLHHTYVSHTCRHGAQPILNQTYEMWRAGSSRILHIDIHEKKI